MKRYSFQFILVFSFFLFGGMQKVSAQITQEAKYFKAKKEFRDSLQNSNHQSPVRNQGQVVPAAGSAVQSKAVDGVFNVKPETESKANSNPALDAKKEQIVNSNLEGKNVPH
jgi:hypothetical protein